MRATVDGMNLAQYALSNPLNRLDSHGFIAQIRVHDLTAIDLTVDRCEVAMYLVHLDWAIKEWKDYRNDTWIYRKNWDVKTVDDTSKWDVMSCNAALWPKIHPPAAHKIKDWKYSKSHIGVDKKDELLGKGRGDKFIKEYNAGYGPGTENFEKLLQYNYEKAWDEALRLVRSEKCCAVRVFLDCKLSGYTDPMFKKEVIHKWCETESWVSLTELEEGTPKPPVLAPVPYTRITDRRPRNSPK